MGWHARPKPESKPAMYIAEPAPTAYLQDIYCEWRSAGGQTIAYTVYLYYTKFTSGHQYTQM